MSRNTTAPLISPASPQKRPRAAFDPERRSMRRGPHPKFDMIDGFAPQCTGQGSSSGVRTFCVFGVARSDGFARTKRGHCPKAEPARGEWRVASAFKKTICWPISNAIRGSGMASSAALDSSAIAFAGSFRVRGSRICLNCSITNDVVDSGAGRCLEKRLLPDESRVNRSKNGVGVDLIRIRSPCGLESLRIGFTNLPRKSASCYEKKSFFGHLSRRAFVFCLLGSVTPVSKIAVAQGQFPFSGRVLVQFTGTEFVPVVSTFTMAPSRVTAG